MTIALGSKPGISGATTLAIPKTWEPNWFRDFINNQLKGADVRNAVGANGIVVSGNLTSPYATIGFTAPVTLPAPVTIAYSPNTANTAAAPTLKVLAPGSNAVVSETGRALMVGGQANAYTAEISGSATTGQSYGLVVRAGTNATDAALVVVPQAGSGAGTMMEIFGDGHGFIGAQIGGSGGLFWDVNSAFTVNAPGAGAALTVVGLSGGVTIKATTASTSALFGVNASIATSGGDYPYFGYNMQATTTPGSYNYVTTDFAMGCRIGSSGAFDFFTAPAGTGGNAITLTRRFTITNAGAVNAPSLGTTASAANAFFDNAASNNFLRSTSSIRYKTNVTSVGPYTSTYDAAAVSANLSANLSATAPVSAGPLTPTQILLALRPITYTSLAEADDPTVQHLGFIAEEANQVDPRLTQYGLDADGNKIPDGFQYERVCVLLVAYIQQLEQRLAAAGIH